MPDSVRPRRCRLLAGTRGGDGYEFQYRTGIVKDIRPRGTISARPVIGPDAPATV